MMNWQGVLGFVNQKPKLQQSITNLKEFFYSVTIYTCSSVISQLPQQGEYLRLRFNNNRVPQLKFERVDISDTDSPRCIFSKDTHIDISCPPNQVDIGNNQYQSMEVTNMTFFGV